MPRHPPPAVHEELFNDVLMTEADPSLKPELPPMSNVKIGDGQPINNTQRQGNYPLFETDFGLLWPTTTETPQISLAVGHAKRKPGLKLHCCRYRISMSTKVICSGTSRLERTPRFLKLNSHRYRMSRLAETIWPTTSRIMHRC